MRFKSFSIAAYSTWNYCGDYHFGIDAGEGMATWLGIGAIANLRNLLMTHDHTDHVAGLAMLLRLRRRIPKLPLLNVWIRRWSHRYGDIHDRYGNANWIKATTDSVVELGLNNRTPITARPFPVQHGATGAVGWKIFHQRQRLNPHFRDVEPERLAKLAHEGTNIHETYHHHILTYTGDTQPLSAEQLGQPVTLMHDATYPDVSVQDDHQHSTLQDAVAAARETGAKLVINHLSTRYERWKSDTPMDSNIQVVWPHNKVHDIDITEKTPDAKN